MNRTNSRAGIFLTEIMLAILFFSIAGALCLQMFVKSRRISTDAANLTQASGIVQNAAELIKHAASFEALDREKAFSLDCLLHEYEKASVYGDKMQIYFDSHWKHCEKENGVYCMEAVPSQTAEKNLFCCSLTVFKTDGSGSVYSLDVQVHIPNQYTQRAPV